MTPILIAEDCEDDVFLIRRSLQAANIVNPLRVVQDGEQVIAYLTGQPPYDDRAAFPLPGLLLLDIRMPRVDGFEVLKWLRQRAEWRDFPVAAMTSAADIRDINAAFALGATSFMIKPIDFMRFAEFAQALSGSWEWLGQSPGREAELAATYAGGGLAA